MLLYNLFYFFVNSFPTLFCVLTKCIYGILIKLYTRHKHIIEKYNKIKDKKYSSDFTDALGNLLYIHVHAANIHDTKDGVFTFKKALYRL